MRLLVTGADGQVGWELRRSLMPLGEVIAMDRNACDLSRLQDLPGIIRELSQMLSSMLPPIPPLIRRRRKSRWRQ